METQEINPIETIDVAAAIIEYRYRYLIVKRAPHKENAGLWEFPGGKVLAGESLKACVERELYEEFELKASGGDLVASVETRVASKIIRLFGVRTLIEHEPKVFKDHTEMRWASFDELSVYAFTSPDLALIHRMQGHSSKDHEIFHVKLLSVGKYYGIFYGLLGTIMGIYFIFSPQADTTSMGPVSPVYKTVVAVMLPFVNFFIGGLFGIILGFFYNLVAEVLGGMKIRIR